MFIVNENYFEFFKNDDLHYNLHLNGVLTDVLILRNLHESAQDSCKKNAEDFFTRYLTFNDGVKQPKSKYLDNKIKSIIADSFPKLLI